MAKVEQTHQYGKKRSIFDYLFYTLAGSVLVAFSFSFLLWLNS